MNIGKVETLTLQCKGNQSHWTKYSRMEQVKFMEDSL